MFVREQALLTLKPEVLRLSALRFLERAIFSLPSRKTGSQCRFSTRRFKRPRPENNDAD
jgi:hypothetical protein